MWFLGLVVVLLIGAVAVVASGRWGAMSTAYDDRPDVSVPARQALTSDDIGAARFGVALRGYRMDEVDGLLERVAREVAERDRRIADLERAVTPIVHGPEGAGFSPRSEYDPADFDDTGYNQPILVGGDFPEPEPEPAPAPEPAPEAEPASEAEAEPEPEPTVEADAEPGPKATRAAAPAVDARAPAVDATARAVDAPADAGQPDGAGPRHAAAGQAAQQPRDEAAAAADSAEPVAVDSAEPVAVDRAEPAAVDRAEPAADESSGAEDPAAEAGTAPVGAHRATAAPADAQPDVGGPPAAAEAGAVLDEPPAQVPLPPLLQELVHAREEAPAENWFTAKEPPPDHDAATHAGGDGAAGDGVPEEPVGGVAGTGAAGGVPGSELPDGDAEDVNVAQRPRG